MSFEHSSVFQLGCTGVIAALGGGIKLAAGLGVEDTARYARLQSAANDFDHVRIPLEAFFLTTHYF